MTHWGTALTFLEKLKQNNSLDWMHENKAAYGEARDAFCAGLGELTAHIAAFDPAVAGLCPEELVFRLNRDVRFAKDKSPYNTAFRAHISPAGRVPFPAGYYVSLSPEASFLGAGAHAAPFPDATRRIRDAIASDAQGFAAVLGGAEFTFPIVGEKLKNVPNGYEKEHPHAEYLKHKSFDVEYPLSDGMLRAEGAGIEEMADVFRRMKPLNDFLNKALDGFTMPKR